VAKPPPNGARLRHAALTPESIRDLPNIEMHPIREVWNRAAASAAGISA